MRGGSCQSCGIIAFPGPAIGFPSFQIRLFEVIFAEKARMTVKKAPNTIISMHPASIELLELLDDGESYRDKLTLTASAAVNAAFPWAEAVNPGSVAVYHVYGTVYYDSWWGFSTREFVDNLKTAEERPEFTAHLLIVDSPGGEVFFCHEAFDAIRSCRKPVVAVCESMCASAAYWIASAAGRVYAVSPFSEVGSIGVMTRFMDSSQWYRTNGYREVEVYATGSDLKNKVYKDAVDGRPEEYIHRFLDPVLETMLGDIRSTRDIPDGSNVLRGDIYYAQEAMGLGLIDGIKGVDECLQEAHDLGDKSNGIINSIYSTL